MKVGYELLRLKDCQHHKCQIDFYKKNSKIRYYHSNFRHQVDVIVILTFSKGKIIFTCNNFQELLKYLGICAPDISFNRVLIIEPHTASTDSLHDQIIIIRLSSTCCKCMRPVVRQSIYGYVTKFKITLHSSKRDTATNSVWQSLIQQLL